jgi:hypothetical protein
MADSSIAGLFMTPELYQQQQDTAALSRAVQMAQLDPMQRANALLGYGGYKAAGGLASALGATDPTLQQISQQQQLLSNVDYTNAKSLAEAARQATAAGRPDIAQGLAQKAIEIQTKIDEKQAAREQAAALAREKIASTEQLAADRNALMAQIAQMNAAMRGANSDVQRQLIEQRIQDLQSKADEKQAQLQSQAQGRVAAFDSALETLDVLSKHPGKKDVVGALTGGVRSMIPGTDAAGFAAQLETFKAQTFIPQVAALKGMGALSDAEGKKLTAAVGALDPKMKTKEFDAQIAKIKADLEAAKQRALTMPGMPKQAAQPATPTKVVKFSDL